MKCLILAAGYATRLYPLTENFPKPLLKVGDKTILDWLIDDIARSGLVDQFVVISNHKFAPVFEQWAPAGVTVVDDGTTSNETRLGAVCDILFAIDKLQLDDDMLVIAGDNVLDFSLRRFMDYALEKGTSCIMRYYEPDEARLHKSANVRIDAQDKVLAMIEKPEIPLSHWCCPPFYYYTRKDARRVREGSIPVAGRMHRGPSWPGFRVARPSTRWRCPAIVMISAIWKVTGASARRIKV